MDNFSSLHKRILDAGLRSSAWYSELYFLYRAARSAANRFEYEVTIADLGTFDGASAIVMAQGIKDMGLQAKIETVDNYTEYEDANAQNLEAKNRIEEFGVSDMVKVIYEDDIQYLENTPNDSLHILFLDSGHTGTHVASVLEKVIEKVARDGLICGHDYDYRELGLVRALEAWREKYRSRLLGWGILDRIWWTIKQ